MTLADRLKARPVVLEVVPPHRRASESTVRKFLAPVQEKAAPPLRGSAGLDAWIRESADAFGLRNFMFVGGSSRHIAYPGPAVAEANGRLRALTRDLPGVALGNITIPERPGEVNRLLAKTRAGSQFFTTQVLFEPGPVLSLLRAYGTACGTQGLEPATVLLSFAPVTDYQDVEFLAWLGASISPRTEERLLAAGTEPGAASLEVAREIWTTIRADLAASGDHVPVGANVEEISTHNFDLAVRMAKELPTWRSDKEPAGGDGLTARGPRQSPAR